MSICFVLNADGEVATQESRFLEMEARNFGIRLNDLNTYASSISKEEWRRTINYMSHEKIEYTVSRWLAAIKADGIIRREELDFAGMMATECGIDLRNYVNAALR